MENTNNIDELKRLAEQGDAGAQNNLGNCYSKGECITQSFEQAVEWFTKAAEQGNAIAQNNLGVCYYLGKGIKKDEEQAEKHFNLSAKQGYAEAISAFLNIQMFKFMPIENKIQIDIEEHFKISDIDEEYQMDFARAINMHIKVTKGVKGTVEKQREEVFICYSKEDIKYVEELHKFLLPLEIQHNITIWYYKKSLEMSNDWENEILKHIPLAKFVICPVSPDFITSGFILNVELPKFVQYAEDKKIKFIWYPLKISDVENVQIEIKNGKKICITKYWAACDKDTPLIDMGETERLKIYREISNYIRNNINS